MASLRASDRGQILLVAALALAVVFIGLALIANTAIFTETLSTRGDTTGSDGALSMREMVERNVGHAVDSANRVGSTNGDSYSTIRDDAEVSIEDVSSQTGRQQARSGRVVDFEVQNPGSDFVEGTRIYQIEAGGSYLTGTGSPLAEDVTRAGGGNGTRAFQINASRLDASDNSSAFRIEARSVTDSNENSWRTNIYEDSGNVHVLTIRNDGGTVIRSECAVEAETPYNIDVTGGRINGEPCHALRRSGSGENLTFGAGTDGSSYRLDFKNGGQIEGNFSMVVNTDDSNVDVGSDVQKNEAIYQATVKYSYTTKQLQYVTDIRVAPGEPNV